MELNADRRGRNNRRIAGLNTYEETEPTGMADYDPHGARVCLVSAFSIFTKVSAWFPTPAVRGLRLAGALLSLLITITGCQTAPSVRRQRIADDIVARFLPTDSSREVATVFGTRHPIAAGIEIRPVAHKDNPRLPPPVYTLQKDSWFFVVDRNSLAPFAHAVTYILAPVDGSAYVVHEESWWPIVEGQNHWYRAGSMQADMAFIVFQGIIASDWFANGRTFPTP